MSTQTQDVKLPRHHSSKAKTEEDIAKKRTRGEITCAECKRLKLKCDKKLPCSSCVRRGCSSICPQGSFTTGQGSRLVLTDTEHLHRKISEMSQRIRQLEEALAIFQSNLSTEPHPLLSDDLLLIKFDSGSSQVDAPDPSDSSLAETMDAFGTLAIGESGEFRYFGRSGGSESLLMADAEVEHTEPSQQDSGTRSIIPDFLRHLSGMFPMGVGDTTTCQRYGDTMDILFDCLPPTTRAWSLLEIYMKRGGAVFQPIKRDHLIEDFLTPIYNLQKEREDRVGKDSIQISPHKIAVLFLIFAIAVRIDFTLQVDNEESEKYYHYARAALTLRSVFDSPMTETVQAVLLLANHRFTAGESHSRDSAWTLLGIACKLALSLGMHRDPARWNMDEKTANKRRRIFWELYSFDVFISLAMGRPPCIELSYVDCTFPQDRSELEAQWILELEISIREGNSSARLGKDVCGVCDVYECLKVPVSIVLYRASRRFQTLLNTTDATEADPPSYKKILELDRKIRESTVPFILGTRDTEDAFITTAYLQTGILSQFKTLTELFLHKSFFAQALIDHPENPLLSRYAASFLATSSCASTIIKTSAYHFAKAPELALRWWTMWMHLFSAAIIVGSIVTRAPSSNMAAGAYLELGVAIDLFAKAAEHSSRAQGVMDILLKLKEKAYTLLCRFYGGSHAFTMPVDTLDSKGHAIDELAIFGGQTQILSSKLLLRNSPNYWLAKSKSTSTNTSLVQPLSPRDSYNPSGLSTTSASESSVDREDMSMQDVHPSLIEYMSMISSATTLSHDDATDIRFSEQANANGITGSSQFPASPSMPDFFLQQLATEYATHQAQTHSPAVDFALDPNQFLGHFYQEPSSRNPPGDLENHNLTTSHTGSANFVDDGWMSLVNWNDSASQPPI